jgi:phosphotransferase system enzyme I (PtsP)
MVVPSNIGGSRILLRKLREIMGTDEAPQERLNRLVAMVASTMVADVCSIYLTRGALLEKFASQRQKPDAVHL